MSPLACLAEVLFGFDVRWIKRNRPNPSRRGTILFGIVRSGFHCIVEAYAVFMHIGTDGKGFLVGAAIYKTAEFIKYPIQFLCNAERTSSFCSHLLTFHKDQK